MLEVVYLLIMHTDRQTSNIEEKEEKTKRMESVGEWIENKYP